MTALAKQFSFLIAVVVSVSCLNLSTPLAESALAAALNNNSHEAFSVPAGELRGLNQDGAPMLEVIFLVDISSSIVSTDNMGSGASDSGGPERFDELAAQRRGIMEVLRSPEMIRMIQQCVPGGIRASYIEWAGDSTVRQVQEVISWTLLSQATELENFASRIGAISGRRFYGSTDIYSALEFARDRFTPVTDRETIRLIFVSGDGVQNASPPERPEEYNARNLAQMVRDFRDELVARHNISIAGIVIDRSDNNNGEFSGQVHEYFQENVVGGPYGFVERAGSFEEYKEVAQAALHRILNQCRW